MLISLSAGCGIPSSLFSLLVAELSLSAESGLLSRACDASSFCGSSLLTWLCTSLSAGLPPSSGAFLPSYPISCCRHFWHRFFGCLSFLCGASHALYHTFSLKLACSSSATLNLATALLSARGQHHCTWRLRCCLLKVGHQKTGPYCESSSGASVLLMACVESLQFF